MPSGYDECVSGAAFYAYVGNDPFNMKDPTGTRIVIDYGWDLLSTLEAYEALQKLYQGSNAKTIKAINDSQFTVTIGPREDIPGWDPKNGNATQALNGINAQNGTGSDVRIGFDPEDENGGMDDRGSTIRPPYVGLAHELAGHANDDIKGKSLGGTPKNIKPGTTPKQEKSAVDAENRTRGDNQLTPRSTYTPTPCVRTTGSLLCQQ